MKKFLYFILLFSYTIYSLPVALIHGLDDSCSNSFIYTLIKILKYNVYNFVVCIEAGEGKESKTLSFEEQSKEVCNKIKSYSQFEDDFSILSLDQGGLIARYIIQKCDMKGTVKKLVSIGGPMMGTSQVPLCLGGVSCFIINGLADRFAYFKSYQKRKRTAEFYRTAAHIEDFKKSNSFVAKLNNNTNKEEREKERERFINLDSLVLIGFKKDKMISPKESAEFGIFNEKFEVLRMNETEEYKNDIFGLKNLTESNKTHIFYLEGEHMEFDYDDILNYTVPYL